MTTKKELMYQRITKHGEQLKKIFNLEKGTDPVKLCKQLFRLENKAHKLSVDYCNGLIDMEEWEIEKNIVSATLCKILKHNGSMIVPVFINGDPRGYALKIDDAYVREHNLDIYRDFGGYGIIAPDFSDAE